MSARVDQRFLLVGVIVALFVAVLLVGGPPSENQQTLLTPVSTAPGGGKVVADALRELDLASGPLERPWSDWVVDDPGATLLVIAPTRAIDDYEAERLVDWIERGGRLVWVPGEIVQRGLNIGRADESLAARLEVRPRTARRYRDGGDRARPSEAPSTATRLALAGAPERWMGWTRAFDVDGDPVVWVEDAAGRPCVFELPVGAGRVLVWGDAASLRNDAADTADLAAVFLRSATVFADDRPLVVDGYSHGLAALGSTPLATWRWLTRTDSGAVALLALGTGLVWLLSRSIRSAPVVPPPPPPGRSSVEHVEALALAYARAHAHARPARLLLDHAAGRLGSVSLETRSANLRRTHPELTDVLDRVDAARRDPARVAVRELAGLAHDLDALVTAGSGDRRRSAARPTSPA